MPVTALLLPLAAHTALVPDPVGLGPAGVLSQLVPPSNAEAAAEEAEAVEVTQAARPTTAVLVEPVVTPEAAVAGVAVAELTDRSKPTEPQEVPVLPVSYGCSGRREDAYC